MAFTAYGGKKLRPKLSELTELILKFSFDLKNISAVIHISKKCAKISVFLCENRKKPVAGRSGAPSPQTPVAHRFWPIFLSTLGCATGMEQL